MRLDSSDVPTEGRRVDHIRVDRIGASGGGELWWVAEAFDDGSAKPEGMYVHREDAMSLAEELAATLGVGITVSDGEAA